MTACVCPKVDVSIYRPNQGARFVPAAIDGRCTIHGHLMTRFSHREPATADDSRPDQTGGRSDAPQFA